MLAKLHLAERAHFERYADAHLFRVVVGQIVIARVASLSGMLNRSIDCIQIIVEYFQKKLSEGKTKQLPKASMLLKLFKSALLYGTIVITDGYSFIHLFMIGCSFII